MYPVRSGCIPVGGLNRFVVSMWWRSIHLQCRRLHDAQHVVRAMLVSPNVWPRSPMKFPADTAKKNIRAMWTLMLERVVSQGGPFTGTPKSDKLENLAEYISSHYNGLKSTQCVGGVLNRSLANPNVIDVWGSHYLGTSAKQQLQLKFPIGESPRDD